MRLDPGLARPSHVAARAREPSPTSDSATRARPAVAIAPPGADDPYHIWLKTVGVGAALACLALLADLTWNFALLAARVRGLVPQSLLRNLAPYFSLGVVTVEWIAVWLLTTEDPLPQRPRRLRANVLRLLVTVALFAVAAWVMRLLGSPRQRTSYLFTFFSAIDLAVIVLMWAHLRWLAGRVGFRGMGWRAVLALLGNGATAAVLVLGPRLVYHFVNIRVDTSYQFRNVQNGLIVLWSAVGAVFLVRFAISALAEARPRGFEVLPAHGHSA